MGSVSSSIGSMSSGEFDERGSFGRNVLIGTFALLGVGPIIVGAAIGAIPLVTIVLIGAAVVIPLVVGGSFLIAKSIKASYRERKRQRTNQGLSNLSLNDYHQESKIAPPLSNQTDKAQNLEEKYSSTKEPSFSEVNNKGNKGIIKHLTSKTGPSSLNIGGAYKATEVVAMNGLEQKQTSLSLNLSNLNSEKTGNKNGKLVSQKVASGDMAAVKITGKDTAGIIENLPIRQ